MQSDDGHHPNYDFIMNPGAKPKKGLFGAADKKQRLLIGVIGIGLILLVFGILFSVLLGGSSTNTNRLLGLVQQQTEIIRVAELGQKDAAGSDAKNLASTTQLTMLSAKNETIKTLTAQGGKVDPKLLGADKDTDTDKALAAAKQANNFDATFVGIMQSELTAYQRELSDFYDDSGSKSERNLLQKLYNQVKLLTGAAQD